MNRADEIIGAYQEAGWTVEEFDDPEDQLCGHAVLARPPADDPDPYATVIIPTDDVFADTDSQMRYAVQRLEGRTGKRYLTFATFTRREDAYLEALLEVERLCELKGDTYQGRIAKAIDGIVADDEVADSLKAAISALITEVVRRPRPQESI